MRHTAVLACLAALTACAEVPSAPAAAPDSMPEVPVLVERCSHGYPAACRELGRAHLVGRGVAADDRLAAAYATKACEIGDAAACGDLAVLAAVGRGVPQADARAAALARRACDGGSALACSNLAVLTVEGVNKLTLGPEQRGEEGPRTARLLRTACDGGAPEGCFNLGTTLETGLLGDRDVPAAALALQRACDLGFTLGCYRVAVLYQTYPGTRRDPPLAALLGAACRDGVAPACDLAKLPLVLATARTPSPRLLQEPRSLALGIPGTGGFHPADLRAAPLGPRRSRDEVRRPTPALLAAVPPPLRDRLGLSAPPRAEDQPDPAVDLLVALRRHQLGACYEGARQHPGNRTEVALTFLVQSDGKPTEVRAAAAPADADLEVCALDAVQAWDFPVPPGGLSGPYLVQFSYEPTPAGVTPAYAPAGGLRPALKRPGCLEEQLRVPPEFRDTVGTATVKLAVDVGGRPILFHAITPVPEPIVAAIGEAVRACQWTPGADARLQPATLWITVPVRLVTR